MHIVTLQVHVEKQSNVADHCRSFALSDGNAAFTEVCHHAHTERCKQCESLKITLADISDAFSKIAIPDDVEKEDLLYRYTESKKAIHAWKRHLVRSVNQDDARIEVLKDMSHTEVMLTQDWAMKFLPRKFRESQAQWFGKRGLSWHITECVLVDNTTQADYHSLTYVHIFDQCSQDNQTVLSILQHILQHLSSTYPHLKRAHRRSDNAGCYHAAGTLAACETLSETGIQIARLDFSAPQNGKGACDRRAAVLKSHVKRYLNEGHDVTTGAQLKSAIESANLSNCHTFLCMPPLPALGTAKTKLRDISLLNNFSFHEGGFRMWKAYGIGPGKDVTYNDLRNQTQHPQQLEILEDGSKTVNSQAEGEAQKETKESTPLFSCSEEGCGAVFATYSNLLRHLDIGEHTATQRTSMDMAKLEFASKIEQVQNIPTLAAEKAEHGESAATDLPQGWALKTVQTGGKFSEKQKQYLQEKFSLGERTGFKLDGLTVSKEMRVARDGAGGRLFQFHEFLTAQQITSYFSRLASKHRQAGNVNVEDSVEDITAVVAEGCLPDVVEEITRSLTVHHPVTFGSRNLCQLLANGNLGKLTLAQLKCACDNFDLEPESTAKRKHPYIDVLCMFLKTCECQV